LALSHVFFNIASVCIGIVFFHSYIAVTNFLVPIDTNPVFASAVFNTIFNVFTALLFAPFLVGFTKLIQKILPNKVHNAVFLHIDSWEHDSVSLEEAITTDSQLVAVGKDIRFLLDECIMYNCYLRGISHEQLLQYHQFYPQLTATHFSNDAHKKHYELCKDISQRLLHFTEKLSRLVLTPLESKQLQSCETVIIECLESVKSIKNIRENIYTLSLLSGEVYEDIYNTLRSDIFNFYQNIYSMLDGKDCESIVIAIIEHFRDRHHDHVSRMLDVLSGDDIEDFNSGSLINMYRELFESISSIKDAVILYVGSSFLSPLKKQEI